MTGQDIETAAWHFVIAAIWADATEGVLVRSTRETSAIARTFVEEFVKAYPVECAAILAAQEYGAHPDAGSPAAAFGHDLYLTCTGHGTGFWDRRELGETGKRISERIRLESRRWNIETYCDRRQLHFCVSPRMHFLSRYRP
ncbi:hypothetical protein [Paraburkholderia adhaesiva]|uniref:hypothetical protein n=1 Tax=Paraburkholderia adhaesiva TaxID=2883244 RepID=UPI001F27C5BA|nr:hypothetical protein [Paraburkholderia adhaesiva]